MSVRRVLNMFIKQYSPHLRYKQRSLIVSILMMTAFQEALALTEQIHREMKNPNQTLDEMSKYYFDGQGKAVRPALTLIMAGACNSHLQVIFGSVRSSRSNNICYIGDTLSRAPNSSSFSLRCVSGFF